MFVPIFIGCKPTAAPVTRRSPLLPPNAPTLTEVAIRRTLAAKATMSVQIDQTDAASLLTPKPKGYLMPTLIGLPTEKPIPTAFPPVSALPGENMTPAGTGIIGKFLPLLNKGRYHIQSEWVENRNNNTQRVFVYTGELAAPDGGDTTQGVVIVQVFQISMKDGLAVVKHVGETEYLTPAQSGSVKIVDVVGERLILQLANGATSYFDVPSRQFVSSLTAIVPTATISSSPLTTPTPVP